MMEHKAFVFDWRRFDDELAPLLRAALDTMDVAPLREFIHRHRSALADPYEGEPLPEDWEAMLETRDADAYGDVALTKYYDPTADLGLRDDWRDVERVLTEHMATPAPFVLGYTFGATRRFDPGKMGSYFRSAAEVRAQCTELNALLAEQPALADQLAGVRRLLTSAREAQRGLYVTF